MNPHSVGLLEPLGDFYTIFAQRPGSRVEGFIARLGFIARNETIGLRFSMQP